MTQRVLLLVAGTPDAVDGAPGARLARVLEGSGFDTATVALPSPEPPPARRPGAAVKARGSRSLAARLLALRKKLGTAKRAVLRSGDGIASTEVWWSARRAVLRAALAPGRGGRRRDAAALIRRFLDSERLTEDGAFSRARAEGLVSWQAGVLVATFSLPRSLLMHPAVLERLVDALRSHHEAPFRAVLADAGDFPAVAAACAVSRILDLPLVLSGQEQSADGCALPARHSLFTKFALERAIRLTGSSDDTARVRALAASSAEPGLAAHGSPERPVVTAVMEASGDTAALHRSIDALRANTVAGWEAVVVVDESDEAMLATITRDVEQLADPRVRVIASPLELLDLYVEAVQHAARADFFVRIEPGFEVDSDYVARVACAVLRPDPAEGYCWIGRVSRSSGARPVVASLARPIPMALRELRSRWYSLEGEYVMNWRLFRAFGGFCHSDAKVHSSHIEEIVLAESAALSGLLFDHEVPLAYKWMSALSKRIGVRSESLGADTYACAQPAVADMIDDTDSPAVPSARLDGMTVMFVRHHLVSYDARLLKESSTLMRMGARVVVLGGADEPPASLVEHGLEVIALQPHSIPSRLRGIYDEVSPDIVHAYDVVSYDLIEPVLSDRRSRLVYECRDLIVAPGYLPDDARGAARARERRIIERADAIIAVSEPSAEWIRTEYGIDDVAAIVHGSSKIVSEPSPVSTPARLLFQGAFRPNRGLFSLVTAVRRLQGRAHLTFQGFGVMEPALREYVRQEGLESHVDFIEACGALDVVTSAAPFDVGIVCYSGSTENLRRTAPNKLIDYMSAGLALVVPDLPGIRSLADESHGVFFEPGSALSLAQAIEPLIASAEVLAAHKAASLEQGRAHAWAVEQLKLVAVYERVLGVDAGHGADASSEGRDS